MAQTDPVHLPGPEVLVIMEANQDYLVPVVQDRMVVLVELVVISYYILVGLEA